MWQYLLDKLDVLVYVVIVVVIYLALLYLWRKLAQLETSFYKLESALANIVINQEKKINEDNSPKEVFMEVFQQAQCIPQQDVEVSAPSKPSISIEEVDNMSETPSTATFTKSKLARMNVEQLREQAEKMGENIDGTKQDLINRILTAQVVEKI